MRVGLCWVSEDKPVDTLRVGLCAQRAAGSELLVTVASPRDSLRLSAWASLLPPAQARGSETGLCCHVAGGPLSQEDSLSACSHGSGGLASVCQHVSFLCGEHKLSLAVRWYQPWLVQAQTGVTDTALSPAHRAPRGNWALSGQMVYS